MTFDHPLLLVVVAHRTGPYIPETSLSDARRDEVARGLITGQYENVLAVIEVDLSTGACREVTHDFERTPAHDHR